MIVGIDLGTTNSLVGVWQDRAVLVPNALGSVLTPSVVSLDRDGSIVVGAAAHERLTSHPHLTAAAFKRYMGTPRQIALGTQSFRAEELASFVIRALRADAEAFLGAPVDEAVITVPAYFSDAQRRATRLAGELAGLKVERVLNEPTAAALAYGIATAPHTSDGSVLVFDLGGGTFDVSVLDINDGVVEVRATAGDNFLGGEDFDDVIVDWFRTKTGLGLPDPLQADAEAVMLAARLRRAAEAARRCLGTEAETRLVVRRPDGSTSDAVLSSETFARLSEPLLERLRRPIARAMSDSRIRTDQLSQIVLAGGATRMPLIRREVARLFGRLPLQQINPDEVVGHGATVQAGPKMRSAALEDVVLTDVAPHTLGISVIENRSDGAVAGRMLPVIERNTVVPVSRMRDVSPSRDFQKQVSIHVFQGESRLVKDNIALGTFDLNLTPRRKHEQSIEVRFTYDINGILEVSARAQADGASERIVIHNGADAQQDQDVQERLSSLAALKIHPREAAANRLLLARAERLFEELLGHARDEMGTAIDAFDNALQSQSDDNITPAAQALAITMERVNHGNNR